MAQVRATQKGTVRADERTVLMASVVWGHCSPREPAAKAGPGGRCATSSCRCGRTEADGTLLWQCP